MLRYLIAFSALFVSWYPLCAQAPSFSKDIRPFFTKYCLECHNAKVEKAGLVLETYKGLMDGADGGPVVKAGKPDESRLVLLCEGKDKPMMPPAKAKFQPTKDEIKLLRVWVMAGAKDDGANVKIELPAIKAKTDMLAPVTGLAYGPKSKELAIGRNNRIAIVNLAKEPFAMEELVVAHRINAIAVSNGSELFTAGIGEHGKEGEVIIVRPPHRFPKHSDMVLDVAIAADDSWMASAGYDAKINLVAAVGERRYVLKEHSDAVYGLAFNPDGKLLASVSADRAMKVFDVEKGKLLYTLGEATDWLYCVAWSPDGKYLVSGGVDKSIRVYEPTAAGAKLRQSVFAHEGPVQKVVFTSDSKTLYSVGQDRIVKAWDIEKMVERKVYDKQPETVLCLALREDAGQFIVGRYDGIVQLIDMKSGKVVHEFGDKKEREKGRRGEKESVSAGGILSPSPFLPFSRSLAGQFACRRKHD